MTIKQEHMTFVNKTKFAAIDFMNYLTEEELTYVTAEALSEVKKTLQQIIENCCEENFKKLVDQILGILDSETFVKITKECDDDRRVMEFAGCCCICDVSVDEHYFDDFEATIRKVITILEFVMEAEELALMDEDDMIFEIDRDEIEYLHEQLVQAESYIDDTDHFIQIIEDIVIPVEWQVFTEFLKLAMYIHFYPKTFSW